MRLLLITLLTLTAGCAAMHEAHVKHNCNYDGAFAMGTNDANEGEPMTPAVFDSCPAESISESKRGYREGYSGASSNGLSGLGSLITINTQSRDSFSCTGSIFDYSFYGQGSSQADAARRVKSQCKKSGNIHCSNLTMKCDRL